VEHKQEINRRLRGWRGYFSFPIRVIRVISGKNEMSQGCVVLFSSFGMGTRIAPCATVAKTGMAWPFRHLTPALPVRGGEGEAFVWFGSFAVHLRVSTSWGIALKRISVNQRSSAVKVFAFHAFVRGDFDSCRFVCIRGLVFFNSLLQRFFVRFASHVQNHQTSATGGHQADCGALS
jgi:hypothetical protein